MKAKKLKYRVGSVVMFIDGDVPGLQKGGSCHRVRGVVRRIRRGGWPYNGWPYEVVFANGDYWYGHDGILRPWKKKATAKKKKAVR